MERLLNMSHCVNIKSVQGSRLVVFLNSQLEDFYQIDFNKKTRKRKPCYSFGFRLSLNKLVKTNECEAFFVSKLQKQIGKLIRSDFADFNIAENCRPAWLTSNKGERLELDFYIAELNLAFEIQGAQHYKHILHFHKTVDEFNSQIRRDKEKKDICDSRGITLIEVASVSDYKLLEAQTAKILTQHNQTRLENFILSKVAQELISSANIKKKILTAEKLLETETNSTKRGKLKHQINITKPKLEASYEQIRYMCIIAIQEFNGIFRAKGIDRQMQMRRKRRFEVARKQRAWI